MQIQPTSIHRWIQDNQIKNEKGELIDFRNHLFLYDIYNDPSDYIVGLKAAQIGWSTLEILKNIYDAHENDMDIIYTLPSDSDVGVFVGGKVNRIIANNPILQQWTADKDSIEQKQIDHSMLYFRGTWTKKAAIMVTADRLVHDELDSSKQDVVKDYEARLQHSRFKQIHKFSHPSVKNSGVDVEWQLSDQKEWFVTCPHCGHRQYLDWNTEDPRRMSVDIGRGIFICKKCKKELSDTDRAIGNWRRRYNMGDIRHDANGNPFTVKWSGYHASLLMAPWVSAEEIVTKYNDILTGKQTTDYFYNKVLGLPYAGSGNSVAEEAIMGRVTDRRNSYGGRMVIGVDTGVFLRWVMGNKEGLISFGQVKAYVPDERLGIKLEDSLEYFLLKFPDSIMVIDKGGDIIGSRQLRKKYPGRVFLCSYVRDRKAMQLIRWGKDDEFGNVLVDRNRMIQLVIDEFRDGRILLFNGKPADWYDYWLHWSHIYRIVQEGEFGLEYKWMRSDRDDWVHATVYWRIGIDRFGDSGFIVGADPMPPANSYMVNPDQTVDFDPQEFFDRREAAKDADEWR